MMMPRSLNDILADDEALANRFEEWEPGADDERPAESLRGVRDAAEALTRAHAGVVAAVVTARADRHSWASIGAMLGTSGEAARQRYGQLIAESA